MEETIRKLLAGVPDYQEFLTLEEMDESSRRLAQAYPDVVEVFSIGQSREGRELLCLKIGDEPDTALMFGLPHPNEPIGTMMLEYFTEQLARDAQLRAKIGYTFYVVKAWDCDGYKLNEKWVKGPYTITNYSRHFFRPASRQQVDWTFPIDYKELHFHDVMPEAEAMMGLIEKIRPKFIYSLHNSGFGGVYWYVTHDIDHGVYETLYEAPRRQNIPIHFGEPESPALRVFYPAVFEGGGIEVEYDYLEKYGVENIAEEINSGTCSDEFAFKLCGAFTFLTEMPYFYDPRIADLSPSDMLRGDAVKARIEWTRESNRRLRDAVALSGEYLSEKNPFRMAIMDFTKDSGSEAELKMVETDPKFREYATQAEKFDNLYVNRFYRLLSYGMLVRANEWELSRMDETGEVNAAKRASLEAAREKGMEYHSQLAAALEEELDYSVIPIKKLVSIQLECGLKIAQYIKTHA